MTNEEINKIYNETVNEFRMLIIRMRQDFIRNNSVPIPGVFDSKELGFYVDGALEVFSRLDKTLDLAYKMTRED